ncbi:hypothetical protein DFH94DRAFT_737942 [Russula ochroleuca]|jgi:hypothetical protein|uniref:Secreted protein n=1 Tax=Russula ochroleuca TaxID=152965 RepID=A0A9P5TA66_9AGAM|nr:hypothetical protein DFH94DRAFT_737942 [Russula ochroleuca]
MSTVNMSKTTFDVQILSVLLGTLATNVPASVACRFVLVTGTPYLEPSNYRPPLQPGLTRLPSFIHHEASHSINV